MLHSEEHLATSDRGLRILPRLLAQQADLAANGGNPLNVAFESDTELVEMECGQYFDQP